MSFTSGFAVHDRGPRRATCSARSRSDPPPSGRLSQPGPAGTDPRAGTSFGSLVSTGRLHAVGRAKKRSTRTRCAAVARHPSSRGRPDGDAGAFSTATRANTFHFDQFGAAALARRHGGNPDPPRQLAGPRGAGKPSPHAQTLGTLGPSTRRPRRLDEPGRRRARGELRRHRDSRPLTTGTVAEEVDHRANNQPPALVRPAPQGRRNGGVPATSVTRSGKHVHDSSSPRVARGLATGTRLRRSCLVASGTRRQTVRRKRFFCVPALGLLLRRERAGTDRSRKARGGGRNRRAPPRSAP